MFARPRPPGPSTVVSRHRQAILCAGQRRRTGIEPACDAERRTPVLKTGGATRHPDASGAKVTRARAASAIRTSACRVQPRAAGPGHPRAASSGGTTLGGMTRRGAIRLTQYARGGGCACKIPPGELEETISKLAPDGPGTDLLVGVENGDDGAVVQVGPAMAVVVTADF